MDKNIRFAAVQTRLLVELYRDSVRLENVKQALASQLSDAYVSLTLAKRAENPDRDTTELLEDAEASLRNLVSLASAPVQGPLYISHDGRVYNPHEVKLVDVDTPGAQFLGYVTRESYNASNIIDDWVKVTPITGSEDEVSKHDD